MQCWAIWDKYSKVWHCDVSGNIAWFPTEQAALAQIESFKSRSARLNGGTPTTMYDHFVATMLETNYCRGLETKKPSEEISSEG